MKKRRLRPAWAFVILSAFLVSSAWATEIPEGVQTNCTRGEFGENQYADLGMALVEEWFDVSGGGEIESDTNRMALAPAPKPPPKTQAQAPKAHAKQAPKRGIPNLKLPLQKNLWA